MFKAYTIDNNDSESFSKDIDEVVGKCKGMVSIQFSTYVVIEESLCTTVHYVALVTDLVMPQLSIPNQRRM